MKKKVLTAVVVIAAVWTICFTFFNKDVDLIEEINFASDPTKNIAQLYLSEKYEPDIYMCLGKTVSDEIYVGYLQVIRFGTAKNPSESMYFGSNALFQKDYYCLKKTQEEGQFIFGFINDENVKSANADGKIVDVSFYDYPNGEGKFGFWYFKTDYDYTIKQFSVVK